MKNSKKSFDLQNRNRNKTAFGLNLYLTIHQSRQRIGQRKNRFANKGENIFDRN